VEKLKTMKERERERKRDVEGLGMRVETCHVCIEREREKKKILCSCADAAWLEKKKKKIMYFNDLVSYISGLLKFWAFPFLGASSHCLNDFMGGLALTIILNILISTF
jgi:hypothetical protein